MLQFTWYRNCCWQVFSNKKMKQLPLDHQWVSAHDLSLGIGKIDENNADQETTQWQN